jgi:hypothetical protein
MSLGRSPDQEDAFRSSTNFCRERLSATSIYALLNRESHRLFPDEAFADLFAVIGRDSIPPRIVAAVMVLQRLHGMSDREAVDSFAFDLRWKNAAGGLDFDHPGFVHTVLVDMRARLRRSERPNRIFESAMEVARGARAHRAQARARLDAALRRGGDTGHGDAHPVGHPRAASYCGRCVERRAARRVQARRRLRRGREAGMRLGRRGGPRGAHRCAGARRLRDPRCARRAQAVLRDQGGCAAARDGGGPGSGAAGRRPVSHRAARRQGPRDLDRGP